METDTTVARKTEMTLADGVLVAQQLLWREGNYEGGDLHFCIAVRRAARQGLFSLELGEKLVYEVYRDLDGCTSIAAFYHAKKALPEVVKADIGYNLKHPVYIKLRDDFLASLRRRLQDKTMVAQRLKERSTA